MQDVFKNAILPEEPDVLGVRLLPLSLGHVYILLAVDNPFAVGGSPHLGHLAFAVQVCSRTFEDCQKWMRSGDLVKDVSEWGKKCRDMDFKKERDIFKEYIGGSADVPERWSKQKSPTPVKHPWPLFVSVQVMPLVGESRAWNMPVAMAMAYWSALSGDDALMTDAELQLISDLKSGKVKMPAVSSENAKKEQTTGEVK